MTMGSNSGRSQIREERGVVERAAVERPAANASSASADSNNRKEKLLKRDLLDMPHVSAGHNHNRVEGFLYRYRKADELRIVCVCHGEFLTPAEFVTHGGGADVAHPLKHIVVTPFPLFRS